MPGPSERSPSGEILDFFDDAPDEPFTASEIADETGDLDQSVQETLEGLVDRGFLRSKEVSESEQIWWLPLDEYEGDGPLASEAAPAEASERED